MCEGWQMASLRLDRRFQVPAFRIEIRSRIQPMSATIVPKENDPPALNAKTLVWKEYVLMSPEKSDCNEFRRS